MAKEREMSLEEAAQYRASLYKPAEVILSQDEKKEQFRIFWAQAKSQYGQPKEMEQIIWLHLVSAKLDKPEDFIKGLEHFGIKKR